MKSHSVTKFFGDIEGPRLLVLGAIHGNEICGTKAIQQIIEDIKLEKIKIVFGSVTFIPVSNPKAYSLKTRRGDRDLNRGFQKFEKISTFEDNLSNSLISVMEECDILLDIHSFRAVGNGFVFVGPNNNNSSLEPFIHAEKELEFAKSLGVSKMVYGWLESYNKFVIEQNAFLACNKEHSNISPAKSNLGVGTTEYFRSIGKYGVTIECGNHDDQKSIDVAYNAIYNALFYLGISSKTKFAVKPFKESYKFSHIIIRHHEEDKLFRPWNSFESVSKGDILALRHTGETLVAPEDGIVIFSYNDAKVGAEWIYYAEVSNRGK